MRVKNQSWIAIAAVVAAAGLTGCQAPDVDDSSYAARTSPLAAPAPGVDKPPWEPGVVLVKWREDARAQVDAGLAASLGLSLVRRSRIGVDKLAVLTEETVPDAAARLSKDPRVIYAEPNARIELTLTPNDPRYSEKWGLNNTGQTGGTPDADIDAPEAWDISTGSRSVIVALLDTGVDYTHPDLVDNIWTNPGETPNNGIDDDGNGYIDDVHGWNFEGAGNNDPMDTMYHGTHCAGIIGATGNNGQGVVGVNWRVTIMPLRIIGNQALDAFCLDAAEAVHYAADNGARLMSCSWWTVQTYSQTLEDAVGYSDSHGVLMVAAAANEYADVDGANMEVWPCEWPYANTICVAATDHNDLKADFSNWGAVSVDVAAPGVDILSTFYPGHGYDLLSGTSMATPTTAGVVALMLSVNPALTAAQVKQTLFATTDQLPALQGITTTGGRINAFRALQAISGVPLPPVADAGSDQYVDTGALVDLDGSDSSDPNQEQITFAWNLTQRPPYSGATLDNPTSPTPSFTADFCGEYVAELVVTDPGGLHSDPDEVHVYAQDWSLESPPVQTPHPYSDNQDLWWTITRPGADFISVHFASFDTESNYDYVYLLDGQGNQIAVYNGPLGEFLGAAVPGDTVQVHFTSDYSITRDGFVIDGVFTCEPPQCAPGQADCNGDPGDGCEVNIDGDPANCGGCGAVCPAPAHGSPGCSGGTCVIASCDAGWDDCDDQIGNGCETNLQGDTGNCGACGNACSFDHASSQCTAGSCQLGACDQGYADCNTDPVDGCEVDTQADVSNCGACDWACTYDHGIAGCQLGSCQLDACVNGYDNCDGVDFNGCEVDLNGDPANCSACGAACPDPPHADPGCAGGSCGIAACDNGWDDCNAQAGDGCETSVAGDPANCGACGQECTYPNANGQCSSGTCSLGDCQAPWQNCDGQAANGCEIDVMSDPANCGGCGQACAYDHGVAGCQAGACQLASCDAGFQDCDGLPATGCEASVMDDLDNCGGCDQACGPFDHAAATCQAGACSMGACEDGWVDCDGAAGNGCEVDSNGDPANCGGCGQACEVRDNASPVCQGGACSMVCEDGFADCDQDPTDGCEVSLGGDTDCTACGDDCSGQFDQAQGACIEGACQIAACNDGFADCDADPANGCETGLGTDVDCAACGDDCSGAFANASGTCSGGGCQIGACDEGYDDCDADATNGCEASLSDESNCGACGAACGQGESCVQQAGTWTCSAECPDADQDGHTDAACGGDDCDDADAQVHPGATEVCGDGIDQDCNGQDLSCECADADGDGYLDYACGGDDCNDADADINPGATEICGNGLDDDCDGLVDGDDTCEGGGGGCGCAASGSPRGALAGLFGLLALVGLIRRRRVR